MYVRLNWLRHILVIAVLLLGCDGGGTQPEQLSADDYAVYAVVLERYGEARIPWRTVRYVVLDSTRSVLGRHAEQALAENPVNDPKVHEAVGDFKRRRGHEARFQNRFPVTAECRLVPTAEIDSVLGPIPQAWSRFDSLYAPNPVGYFRLSRVGFSHDGSSALVFFANVCGPLCGKSGFLYLQRRGSAWRVVSVWGYVVA